MKIFSNKKTNSSLFSRFPCEFILKKELVRKNTIHLKTLFGLFLVLIIVSNSNLFSQNASSKGLPIAYWDFENNANRTVHENTVEQAINSNCVFQGKLGGNTTTICARTGNGTTYGNNGGAAIVSGGWVTSSTPVKPTNPVNPSTQSFFEFRINTTGFLGIGFSIDLYSNGSGSNYPSSAYSISTDLGLTWSDFSTDLSSRGNWESYFFSL